MLEQKLEQLANAIKPRSKEVKYLKEKKEKEINMPGHYNNNMMKKTKKAKKQAATAMAMKKAGKKPKKKKM